MTASVSSTPVPSFSKRARLRMRSKMDASSALSAFGGAGVCAPAFAMERKTERAIMRRTTRGDILQFLYAVASVKSNQGRGVAVAGIVRMLALAVFCLGAFAWAQTAPPLTIVDETLPSLDPAVDVRIPLTARGGVPPYHWSVTAGNLPEGISLTPDGVLVGRPTTLGRFAYTVTVEDSARPANRISKELQTVVSASLVLEWLRPPQVRGDRIDGAVQISNGTNDDFDLTFIIVAINEIGRAIALGYQHFTLKAGTANFQIPFGQTLPHGAYVVHADAVAEIPARNRILRRLLETPAPLPVTQGP